MRTNRFNTGIAFQAKIQATARQYEAAGIMRLKKVDPPTRVLGGGAARRIIFLENPFLDFMGTWTERGGRAVFIECKSTSKPKLPFDTSGGITEKQMTSLRNWHNAGAVAFVLWEYRDQVRLVPASQLAAKRDAARAGMDYKYIAWEESGPDIGQGKAYNLVDFIPRVRKLWP